MKTQYEKTKYAMQHHGIPMAVLPTLPTAAEHNFRLAFIVEEMLEMHDAYKKQDLVALADAIADTIIVAYGYAAVLGLPMDAILNVVHYVNTREKHLVATASESKRGYAFDLKKTADFKGPEAKIAELLTGVGQ